MIQLSAFVAVQKPEHESPAKAAVIVDRVVDDAILSEAVTPWCCAFQTNLG